MMMNAGRTSKISSVVKGYDPMLYCSLKEGKPCVFRKSIRVESYDVDGTLIHFVRPAPYFVFALTDNWQLHGNAVDWGAEPILARLKAIDIWKRDIVQDLIDHEEEQGKIREKDLSNSIEDFLKDFRRQFARTFNDVNTSTMKKFDRRRKDEENGNHK